MQIFKAGSSGFNSTICRIFQRIRAYRPGRFWGCLSAQRTARLLAVSRGTVGLAMPSMAWEAMTHSTDFYLSPISLMGDRGMMSWLDSTETTTSMGVLAMIIYTPGLAKMSLSEEL